MSLQYRDHSIGKSFVKWSLVTSSFANSQTSKLSAGTESIHSLHDTRYCHKSKCDPTVNITTFVTCRYIASRISLGKVALYMFVHTYILYYRKVLYFIQCHFILTSSLVLHDCIYVHFLLSSTFLTHPLLVCPDWRIWEWPPRNWRTLQSTLYVVIETLWTLTAQ